MTSSPAPQTDPADLAIWRMSGDETTTQLMVGAEAVHLDKDRLEDCDCTCGEDRCGHLRAAAAYQGTPVAWIAELDAQAASRDEREVSPVAEAREQPASPAANAEPAAAPEVVEPATEDIGSATRPRSRRRHAVTGSGHRCSRCGEDKPAEAFGYDRYNCLACVRRRIADYRARKKAAA